MIITKSIKMDLLAPGAEITVEAVQGDNCSRCLEFRLYTGEKLFQIPEGTTVTVRYRKPDRTGGEYDTLPDGTPAWQVNGNRVTVTLAPQTLTYPGNVRVVVTLIHGGKHLSAFPVSVNVRASAHVQTAESQNYFYVTGILPAPVNASVGDFVRVSEVNNLGQATALETVAPDSITGSMDSQQVTALIEQYLSENPQEGEPGKDGADGKDGTDGKDGMDGISVTHAWNGTILTVTSASGTSAANLKGEKGDRGPAGADGTGVTILGSYSTEEALKQEHPTASPGDAYLICGDLYVWAGGAWINAGNIQGPAGKTPVKGTDYWTEEDVSEIESYIGNAVTDRFGKGASIPSGADLDDYRTIGKYYANSNALAQSLTNCPTTQNFLMYVFVRTSDGTQSQMIIDLAGKLYIRSRSSTSWRSWVTYITKEDLTSAVNAALQEAKNSGAFKGEDGRDGADGTDGTNGKSAYEYAQEAGYTGTESAFADKLAKDYIDWFRKGTAIPSGADLNTYKTVGKYYAGNESLAQTLGNCPTGTNFVLFVFDRTGGIYSQMIITLHGGMYLRSANSSTWRDWVHYVTDAQVETAISEKLAEAKESGYFGTGAGSAPVKGVDYWTKADQESIVQQVITALGTPVFGTVEEGNMITLTGDLEAGTYTLKYEGIDGSKQTIGTVTLGQMINQIPVSTDASGAVFNGVGYQSGYRISSSGEIKSFDGQTITGFIPCKYSDTVRFTADMFDAAITASAGYNVIAAYDANKTFITNVYVPNNDLGGIEQESTNVWLFDPSDLSALSKIGYVRFCMNQISANSIVTVNQKIS